MRYKPSKRWGDPYLEEQSQDRTQAKKKLKRVADETKLPQERLKNSSMHYPHFSARPIKSKL